MKRTPSIRFVVGVFLILAAGAALAQEGIEGIRGRLVDPAGQPLVGYRVVFEPIQGANTYLSQPTNADGEYIASLPSDGEFLAVALINPQGTRIELAGQQPFTAAPGTRTDLQVAELPAGDDAGLATIRIAGTLTDGEGAPLAGYRVVFRAGNSDEVAVSEPSDEAGEYRVDLVERGMYQPLAVMAPSGRRIDLEESAIQARTDVRGDFSVPAPRGAHPLPMPAFPGADRLFQAFIEDAAIVEHWRLEFGYENIGANSYDTDTLFALGAIQFDFLPQVELGARIGVGHADVPAAVDGGSGLTDLDIWGKLLLGPMSDGVQWAPGFRLRFPTGQNTLGLGADAFSTELFTAVRQTVPGGVVSYRAAVEVTADGEVGNVPLEGTVAASTGAAYILAPSDEFTVITEINLGLERFKDLGPDIRLSAGLNWKVPNLFTVRAALAAGLSDAAPDYQLTFGVAFDY